MCLLEADGLQLSTFPEWQIILPPYQVQHGCADAAEDVLALSCAAIDVMPPESLRGALFCATDMLRNQRQKAENALKEENGANRLQQEVSVLANSLKVRFVIS